MQITFFSLLSSVLWFNAFVAFAYFLRKGGLTQHYCSVFAFIGVYALGIIRAILPLDFSWAIVIPEKYVYPIFYQIMTASRWEICGYSLSVVHLLMIAWFNGFLFQMLRYALQYKKVIDLIRKKAIYPGAEVESLIREIALNEKKQIMVSVYRMPNIRSPYGMGVLHKRILLPLTSYSDKDLYHILHHEYTHFMNHDTLLKQTIIVFCMVFWWNPVVYFLKRDFEQILELRCDVLATANMNDDEKADYLETIVHTLRGKGSQIRLPYGSTAISASYEAHNIQERFDVVIDAEVTDAAKSRSKLLVIIALIVLIFSYGVILQPSSDAPKNSETNAIEFNAQNTYIVLNSAGEYWLYVPGLEPVILSSASIEIFKQDGFRIIEEP